MQICQAKQMVCALARLYVLEGDVMDRLTTSVGVVDILQHLHATRTYIDFIHAASERRDETACLIERALSGAEAREDACDDGIGRQIQLFHSAYRYQQGLRGIQPARYADHEFVHLGGTH